MPIICGSRSTARSGAKSAMNSSSRCAAAIIARSIAVAMKPHGGAKPESTPSAPPGRFGPRHTRFGRLLKPRTLISRRPREQRPSDSSIRSAAAQGHPKSQNEANYRGRRAMTSFRQIEANRRNACKSTGPITEEGKQRSRCNAVRHGLTAETVIGALEDAEDYKAFEAAIIADYDAQSAVERELVLRLASLLWRLRRATGGSRAPPLTYRLHSNMSRHIWPSEPPSTPARFARARQAQSRCGGAHAHLSHRGWAAVGGGRKQDGRKRQACLASHQQGDRRPIARTRPHRSVGTPGD